MNIDGALALLMKDALAPNLVQTIEGGPALIHGGPFANIAHGCNSLIATRAGTQLGDIVVTEAGFGSDLGAEKFFDIKCRMGGLEPQAAVVVATLRAMKHHVSVTGDVDSGFDNLMAHVENVRQFGVPAVVAINRFADDTDEEVAELAARCEEAGVRHADCDVWARGGEGGEALAGEVLDVLAAGEAAFRPLYATESSLREKLETVASRVYGADGLNMTPAAAKQAQQITENGLGGLPVCVAKTQYSLSDDPTLLGRPHGFDITVREFRISAGAGFVVALTGDVMTMPGLAARPAAEGMRIHPDGRIEGLF